jgi:hypothetical protein
VSPLRILQQNMLKEIQKMRSNMLMVRPTTLRHRGRFLQGYSMHVKPWSRKKWRGYYAGPIREHASGCAQRTTIWLALVQALAWLCALIFLLCCDPCSKKTYRYQVRKGSARRPRTLQQLWGWWWNYRWLQVVILRQKDSPKFCPYIGRQGADTRAPRSASF